MPTHKRKKTQGFVTPISQPTRVLSYVGDRLRAVKKDKRNTSEQSTSPLRLSHVHTLTPNTKRKIKER